MKKAEVHQYIAVAITKEKGSLRGLNLDAYVKLVDSVHETLNYPLPLEPTVEARRAFVKLAVNACLKKGVSPMLLLILKNTWLKCYSPSFSQENRVLPLLNT